LLHGLALAGRAVTLAGWLELQWLALAMMLGLALLLIVLGPRSQRVSPSSALRFGWVG
jgi:hypothetical protein